MSGRVASIKSRAMVLGRGSTALGVIRALGQKGASLIAADYIKHGIAALSKYVQERVIIPDPRVSTEATISFLVDNSAKWRGSLLIPTDDCILVALSQYKAKLSEHYIVPVPEWGVVEKCVNKKMALQVATEVGIRIPQSFFPNSVDYLEEHKAEFWYPCILKPVFSRKFIDEFKVKVFETNDFEELKSYYYLATKAGNQMVIQEIIPGTAEQLYAYYAYRDSAGDLLAEFTYRKIRQSPPSFGTGTAIESTYTPEIMELGRRFLDKLGYTGICEIEFKRDARDSQFKFIEINARFGNQVSLPVRCGVDLPWILYQDLINGEKVRVDSYQVGVKWGDLSSDLSTFARYYRKKYGWGKFIKTYMGNKASAIYQRDDLKPFVIEWLSLLSRFPNFLFRLLLRR